MSAPIPAAGGRRRVRCGGTLAMLAALVVLGPVLTACGADDKASSGEEPAAARPQAGQGADGDRALVGGAGDSHGTDSTGAGGAGQPSPVVLAQRQVIRTAAITVQVDDVVAAAVAARALGPALGGLVSSEKTQRSAASDAGSPGDDADESVIEVKVPQARLDEALERLAALGRERSRAVISEDVTAQIADLDGRIATARQALTRVRQLLGRAASVKEILELEQDLTRRESDLEGLQRRVAALRGQADLSTVTVTLVGPGTPIDEPEEAQTGFVGGLKGGWHALTRTFVAGSAIAGALLPWLVPAGAVGALVVVVRRRWGARLQAWRAARGPRYPVRGAPGWPAPQYRSRPAAEAAGTAPPGGTPTGEDTSPSA